MSAILTGALLLMSGLLLLPVLILLAQVVCALLPGLRSPLPDNNRPRVAVLVPAQNEAAGIKTMLAAVMPQLGNTDRVLVVADNCTDETAAIAAVAGAEVVERCDALRRGKGYALDFGIRCLEADPPDIVVVVDADCELGEGAVQRISNLSAMSARPVQALYLMSMPAASSAIAPIAEFAMVVKNHVRPLGCQHIGLPCQLMGTGMAFPWALISSVSLASAHLVEDLKLGIDCARAGRPPLFCPDALVLSRFPANKEGARSQRLRWEHGHLAMILGQAPRLFLEAVRRRRGGMLALVVDMCVPPLALLTLAVLAAVSVTSIFFGASGNALPMQVSAAALAGLFLAVLLAWTGFGRKVVSFASLACAPLYAIRKVPLYLKFLQRRQVEWVRSRRDEG